MAGSGKEAGGTQYIVMRYIRAALPSRVVDLYRSTIYI
jgi:hypothetical protein